MSFQQTITLPRNTDFFVLSAPISGYGARVFVRRGAIEDSDDHRGNLRAFLRYSSCWGNADKEWRDMTSGEVFEGYELPHRSQAESNAAADGIAAILAARGLKRGAVIH